MSETRYDAHPSMLRMRPFSTLVLTLVMLAGLVVALLGAGVMPESVHASLDARVLRMGGLVAAALCALQLLIWWIQTRFDHLVVRDDELLWTRGLLSKSYTEIKLSSVRTVRLHQSLLQRMLDAGDIRIYSAGDVPELVVRGLPHPNRLRALLKGD